MMRLNRSAVATPNATATAAGIEMLQMGGTAIDAAMAAAFVLTVVNPSGTGLAGYGGCMVICQADRGTATAIDFNCRAPGGARPDMYTVLGESQERIAVAGRSNEHGALAVEVSGMVAGLTLAQEQFGTLPRATVMAPAVRAAREGFPIDAWTADLVAAALFPHRDRFPETYRLYSVDGRPPQAGNILQNPDLADTLSSIARNGADAFYKGEIARAIVDTVQRNGGILTLEDLASYQPSVATPQKAQYRGRDVLTVPGPSGGLTILQCLRLLEGFDIAGIGDEVGLYHLLVEVTKVGWRERLLRMGDPQFTFLDPAAELAEDRISWLRAEVMEGMKAPQPGRIISPDPLTGTIHICTADRQGNVVSLTHTHGGSFGSMVTAPGTGLVLSHGMSRFDPRTGLPNSVAPGKQPLNNMSPIIVLRDGSPELALGGAGGRTLVTNVLHTLVRCIDLNESPESALRASRFHLESAEPVGVEEGAEALAEGLRLLGHQVRIRPRFGGLQALRIGPNGEVNAAADHRRQGVAAYA